MLIRVHVSFMSGLMIVVAVVVPECISPYVVLANRHLHERVWRESSALRAAFSTGVPIEMQMLSLFITLPSAQPAFPRSQRFRRLRVRRCAGRRRRSRLRLRPLRLKRGLLPRPRCRAWGVRTCSSRSGAPLLLLPPVLLPSGRCPGPCVLVLYWHFSVLRMVRNLWLAVRARPSRLALAVVVVGACLPRPARSPQGSPHRRN